MISFNQPTLLGTEQHNISRALINQATGVDGHFTKSCLRFLQEKFSCEKVYLTASGTSALEMAALTLDIKPGDEVILPSFTYVSTANAFLLRGATLVFVDIRADDMNLDFTKIEAAITPRTKVIVPVHYAGRACNMDEIMKLSKAKGVHVVEDAAQAIFSKHNGKQLGIIGDIGIFSFHETKNFTSAGSGGAIMINNKSLVTRADIIYDKGTDRSRFLRGEVDKYSWQDVGAFYQMTEIQAAYLAAQFDCAELIHDSRMEKWEYYYDALKNYVKGGLLTLPSYPDKQTHNAHIFFVKVLDRRKAIDFIYFMKVNGIACTAHYVPLHSSPSSTKHGCKFIGEDYHTTVEAARLVRLPLFHAMLREQQDKVVNAIRLYILKESNIRKSMI